MPLAKVRIFARLCPNVRERSMRLVRGTTSYCRGTLIAATTRRATPFTSSSSSSSSSSSATTLLLLLLRRAPPLLFSCSFAALCASCCALRSAFDAAFCNFGSGFPSEAILARCSCRLRSFPQLFVSFLRLYRSLEEEEEEEEQEHHQLLFLAPAFLLSSSSSLDFVDAKKTRLRRFQTRP